ncbi:MAG: PEP-utilizing enzyme [Candidatus Woesearchaeota archaeon]
MKPKIKYIWKREYSLFYGVNATTALFLLFEDKNQKCTMAGGKWHKGIFASGLPPKEYQKYRNKIEDILRNHPELYEQDIKNIHKNGKAILDFCMSIKADSKTPLEELKRLYNKFYELLIDYDKSLWYGFYYPDIIPKILEEELKEYLSEDDVYKALIILSKPSQKAAILKIHDYFKKQPDINERIKHIKEEYPWIGSIDPFSAPFSDAEISQFAESFNVQKEEKKKNIPIKESRMTRTYQELLYIKGMRDEYRRKSFYYAYPFIQEISKRYYINQKDFGLLLPDDLDKPNLKELADLRKKGCLIYITGKGVEIDNSKEAQKSFEEVEKIPETDKIKGIIGNKGFVKGKVQLVMSKEDVLKFRKGNILVSITTNPDHVPAMQKAIAVVTDEGGITCHAAIVSRELKIPCVIGTKIATRVLKDGDLVEVDAEKGIVKRIK